MKIKIKNIPGFSHEYLVTATDIEEIPNGYVKKFKLGINKYLLITYIDNEIASAEFDTSKKIIKIPPMWFEIIN